MHSPLQQVQLETDCLSLAWEALDFKAFTGQVDLLANTAQ